MRSNPHIESRLAPALPVVGRIAATVVCVVVLAFAGCDALEEDDGPPRPFGPGVGGTPPLIGSQQTGLLTSLSGGTYGRFDYDDGYWTSAVQVGPTSADPTIWQLTGSDGLVLLMRVIFGRPDTPCRFEAALAARDFGFVIQGDGEDRINALSIEFHEVLLSDGTTFLRLDCARLSGTAGVEAWFQGVSFGQLGTEQVHFVLNSIRP